ncbi:MAG: hypothetical protein ACK4VW_07680 [Anaerolineales bacterium]
MPAVGFTSGETRSLSWNLATLNSSILRLTVVGTAWLTVKINRPEGFTFFGTVERGTG